MTLYHRYVYFKLQLSNVIISVIYVTLSIQLMSCAGKPLYSNIHDPTIQDISDILIRWALKGERLPGASDVEHPFTDQPHVREFAKTPGATLYILWNSVPIGKYLLEDCRILPLSDQDIPMLKNHEGWARAGFRVSENPRLSFLSGSVSYKVNFSFDQFTRFSMVMRKYDDGEFRVIGEVKHHGRDGCRIAVK